MGKKSAGILAYQIVRNRVEVFLVHPGGPFWRRKEIGAWSIPKGEYTNEEPLAAARREFLEETGAEVEGTFVELAPVRYKDGKAVAAWAVEAALDPAAIRSNSFEMEWPPGSGRMQAFEEVDRADWFPVNEALVKIHAPLRPLIEELQRILKAPE